MHRIFTYMLVRNLTKINIDFIYKKKPIIHKCTTNSIINNSDWYFSLCL